MEYLLIEVLIEYPDTDIKNLSCETPYELYEFIEDRIGDNTKTAVMINTTEIPYLEVCNGIIELMDFINDFKKQLEEVNYIKIIII